jgi:hypothetical protein
MPDTQVVASLQTFDIALNGTVSTAVDLENNTLVGLELPAAFTGIAITFQGSNNNGTFKDVKKEDGTSYTLVVAQNTYVLIPPSALAGLRYVKIVSGSAEGAARSVKPIIRKIM